MSEEVLAQVTQIEQESKEKLQRMEACRGGLEG